MMFSSKTLVVADREYWALVRTKAFLIGLLLPPALLVLGFLLLPTPQAAVESGPRRVAVVDGTGQIAPLLSAAAKGAGLSVIVQPPEASAGSSRIRLVRAVNEGAFAALLEIPKAALELTSSASDAQIVLTVRNLASPGSLWIHQTLDDVVRRARLQASGVDPERARQLLAAPPVLIRLSEGTEEGSAAALKGTIAPVLALSLVFFTIILSAPYMLHSVIEEKQQRIAEVLLGSMSTFEFMGGKLLGAAGAGLTVLLVYTVAGFAMASEFGLGALLSPSVLSVCLIDVILGLVMFGSLFLAAGAAASDVKEAQALMLPLTFVLVTPMVGLANILGNPDGQLAVALSLFPLTAPLMLPPRLASTLVPIWQIVVSAVGTMVAAAGSVWVAGRIFRIGILAQGQPPKLRELLRWIRSK